MIAALYAENNDMTMAQRIALNTHNAPQAIGPYSQAILVKHPQEIVYISGQLPIDPQTGKLLSDPFEGTKQCMQNIVAILSAAGMTLHQVVDVMILLKDINDFKRVNEAYASFFHEPYPARATFQTGCLPMNAVVEIKVTAVK